MGELKSVFDFCRLTQSILNHASIFCTSTFTLTFLPFRLLCLGQNCPLKKYAQGLLQEENAGKSTKSADWI